MSKKAIFTSIVLSLFLTVSAAKAVPTRAVILDPLDLIWQAIANLQQQIDNIELIPGPQGEQGEQGLQGPIGPQGPAGASTVFQGSPFFAQVIDGGETKVWSWTVSQAGSYLAYGRVNYRLQSSVTAASSIECRLKEESSSGAYDTGEGFISQDQTDGSGLLRGVSTKGTMTLVGTILNAPAGMHLSVECFGMETGGFVGVDKAGIHIVPVTSVLSINQVAP